MSISKLFIAALILHAGSYAAQTEETKEEKERPFQLTLVTPLGTNGMEAHKIVNNVSINLFAGVSRGVNGAEFGGFGNVALKHVRGTQMAGFTNVALGNVTGAQFAGYVNYSGGNYKGAAFAGFCNVNKGALKGGQFAGFANVNLDTLQGGQLAGFCNYNHKNAKGLQGAAFANVTRGNLKGAQIAGFANVTTGNVNGLQGAGFANVTKGDHKGAQLSGFANVATGNVNGLQASGFFNYAKKVKGAQLGIINISDTVDGATIGFLNIVKKGLHQVELSADELFYGNVGVRTGTYKFYNIFSAGASPKSGNLLWHISYGVGTSVKVNDRMRSDITLSAQHVSNGLFYFGTSELYKVYVGMEYKLADKCYIAAGPTFNLYFGDTILKDYDSKYSKVAPYSMLNETNSDGFNFRGWLGAKVAIRFL